MKSGRKNKKNQSPSTERTRPSDGLQEQELPASPGKGSYKPGFLSRFLSKSTVHDPPPVLPSSAGRVTPEQHDRSDSLDKPGSRDNSPKTTPISLASSTYRNLSQSLTDLAAMTSRSKPQSPDIEPINPPSVSVHSSGTESSTPPGDKPPQLPFKPDSIQRQGWLNKRPDSDSKRSKSGVSAIWKLQRAIVHDSRLYLYNPPSSLGIKAFSPSSTPVPSHTVSPQTSVSHFKHTHSPSEASGLAAQASSGQPTEALERRPSTAPHQFPKGIPKQTQLIADQNVSTVTPSTSDSSIGSLRQDDEAGVVGGTVIALCYHMLSGTETGMSEDCRIFCTTVGFWAPVEVVLLEMTRISSKRNVVDRLELIIRFWCDHTPRILWEDGSKAALLTLVEEGVTRVESTQGSLLAEYIIEAEKKFKDLLYPAGEATNDSLQRIVPYDSANDS
jgi:hypothetical protein